MQNLFLIIGAIAGFLGVALGAFGAHGLRGKVSEDLLSVFEVGVRYQMYHALGLIGVGWMLRTLPSIWLRSAGWLFVFGMIIFSGSLYILVFTGIQKWGAVTPIGGICLLLGWLCLVVSAFKA